MARKRQPSQTQVRETLMQSVFNPREKSPMSIVVGIADPSYEETKAIELPSGETAG